MHRITPPDAVVTAERDGIAFTFFVQPGGHVISTADDNGRRIYLESIDDLERFGWTIVFVSNRPN